MLNLITLPWRLLMRALNKLDELSEREVAKASRDAGCMTNDQIDKDIPIWVESGRKR